MENIVCKIDLITVLFYQTRASFKIKVLKLKCDLQNVFNFQLSKKFLNISILRGRRNFPAMRVLGKKWYRHRALNINLMSTKKVFKKVKYLKI